MIGCFGCDGLFRFAYSPLLFERHMLMREQCSLAHQLLPKNEHTKPEEVRILLYTWTVGVIKVIADEGYRTCYTSPH